MLTMDKTYETMVFKTLDIKQQRIPGDGKTNEVCNKIACSILPTGEISRPQNRKDESRWSLVVFLS